MKQRLLLALLLAFYSVCYCTTYFIAPTGSDANTGGINSPFGTIQYAVNKAVPGDIIYLRGGTYKSAAQINITPANSGNSTSTIKLWAYNNEKPLLDFSAQPITSGTSFLRGFVITGDYWHLKGFEIYAAADNGIKLEGNYNTIEMLVIHHCGDSGIQLGFGHTTNQNNPGNLCAYNKIINCDSYRNYDYDNYGADADGFACKMHNGKGNIFFGCRSWENADDAWDLFETDWPVQLYYCWAWHSADKAFFLPWHAERTGKATSSFQGNGNGIKLGGDGEGGQSKGTHVVGRCVSFNNTKTTSVKGFDQNSHKGGLLVYHCLAWNNGYNYMFETTPSSGNANVFINNVSIKGTKNDYEIVPGSAETNNSWNLVPALTANASDYITLTEEAAKAPRQADGTLPDNGFARLVAGSDLIDKGKKIDSIAFLGTAPDLGPYEYQAPSGIEDFLVEEEVVFYPNPFQENIFLNVKGTFTYTVRNLQGSVMLEGKAVDKAVFGSELEPGVYTVQYISDEIRKTIKISKSIL